MQAGETLVVHSNRRAVAQIVPLVERPTWLPSAEFFSRVLAHPADPGLRDAEQLTAIAHDADLLTQDADFDTVPGLRVMKL